MKINRRIKMKSKVKIMFVLMTVVLVFAMVLAACGGAEEETLIPEETEVEEVPTEAPDVEPPSTTEPVTITYWHTMSDPETEQLEKVVAAFEAANPGITVETTRFAYDDFKPEACLIDRDCWRRSARHSADGYCLGIGVCE